MAVYNLHPDFDHRESDHATISVHGAVDEGCAQRLRSQVNALLQAGARHLVIDLSAAPSCDSALARELAWVRERLRARGGRLTVTLAGQQLDASDVPLAMPLHERVPEQRGRRTHSGPYRPETADQP